ncbi:hypothetical protein C0989_001033 [Termitomyces sp. Mn162]|nr:hypothetical protein C0989_001033 [Termitomyces sp. Mn162]
MTTTQKPTLVSRISAVISARVKTLFKPLTLLAKALLKKKFSMLRYEWLYKDVPDCPPLEVTACAQHVRLSVGAPGNQSTRNPLLHIRDMLEESVVVGRAIKVSVELKTGKCPPEQGLRHLGGYLAFIGKEEIDFKLWTELEVNLPVNEPLPFTVDSRHFRSLLPANAFTNLKRLTWSAHREQLVASWLPFTPSLLLTLTNLVICCDLSLIDCSYILYHAKQLKELTVCTLRKDLSHYPVLSQQFYASDVPHLTSLILRSDDDLVPLLTRCKFPSLRYLDLDLLDLTTLTVRSLKFGLNLNTINLSGDLKQEDVDWISSQYSHVYHIFIPGLAVFLR